MKNKNKPVRFILLKDNVELTRKASINEIALWIGCTKAHIYNKLTEDKYFSYKKNNYQLVDRLA